MTDFPHPDVPMMHKDCPAGIDRLISLRTTLLPKVFARCEISIFNGFFTISPYPKNIAVTR